MAIEMDADCILLAKSIDGVYDSDPKVNPNAKSMTRSRSRSDRQAAGVVGPDCFHYVYGTIQNADGGILLKRKGWNRERHAGKN